MGSGFRLASRDFRQHKYSVAAASSGEHLLGGEIRGIRPAICPKTRASLQDAANIIALGFVEALEGHPDWTGTKDRYAILSLTSTAWPSPGRR